MTPLFLTGHSSEFGQAIFIVGSLYRTPMNIKELNMVDWTEAETARKEDDKPKADHRTTPQYIAYLNKSAKRKDSTSTSNIIEEFNE